MTIPLLIALIYSGAFIFLYYYFDKSMRRNGTRHRKSIGFGLSVFHSLCWIVIMFFLQDYETVIMPCAGALIGVSVALSLNEDKQA